MKKYISLMLALLISVLSIPAVHVYAANGDGIYGTEPDPWHGSCGINANWSFNTQTKHLSISGRGDVYDSEYDYEMRWKNYKDQALSISIGEGITSLCDDCFSGFTKVKIIELPSTLEKIGANAFQGCSIQSVSIPACVTYIGNKAFNGCSGLNGVTLPDALSYLGTDAFAGCSGIQYNIFEGGCYLGSESNPYMAYIKVADKSASTVSFAENVKFINTRAFVGNTNIVEASVPDGITFVDGISFFGCTKLKTVKLPSDLQVICDSMFGGCKALSEIQIPETVKSIGKYAFRYCTALSEIEIPDSVEAVGADAFLGCSALEKVSIGKALNYTDRIFNGCDSVKNVSVSAENPNLSYQSGMIVNTGTAIDAFPAIVGENLIIPSGVKAISDSIFEGFSVKSIAFSEGLEKIGVSSFMNCKNLTGISFPDSLVSIGMSAFEGCSGLEYVRVGKSLKTINALAFYGCKNLLEVEDDSLLALKAAQGTTQYGEIVRYAANVICSPDVYVEIDGCSFKKNESENYTLISYTGTEKNLVLPETVNGKTYEIGSEAFADTDIESLVMPDAVTKIGAYAFRDSKNLIHVTLGRGISRLCNEEFAGSNVETVDMTSSVTLIYPTSFVDCKLTQINYMGTRERWQSVNIDWERFSNRYDQTIYEKSALSTAKVVCYCTENGHTEARRVKKAATCLERGTKETYCTVCGEVLSLSVTPFGAHNYEHGVCTVCGELLKGDMDGNGKLNSIDSQLLKRVIMGQGNSPEQNRFADVNGDGKVNSVDGNLLKRKILGAER